MQKKVDVIREAASVYIQQARRSGWAEITLTAGQIVKDLGLQDRVPAVCSALSSKRFLKDNDLELERREGPPSGISTTTRFTYRLRGYAPRQAEVSPAFMALRGAGKATYAALGGGEQHLLEERQAFLEAQEAREAQ